MRMWMVDPKIMCQKHLCGMHVELHMFIGSMQKNVRMNGFINNDLLEPLSIKEMHDKIASEMISRGYNHKSYLSNELVENSISRLNEEYLNHRINKELSLNELISRCDVCRSRYNVM